MLIFLLHWSLPGLQVSRTSLVPRRLTAEADPCVMADMDSLSVTTAPGRKFFSHRWFVYVWAKGTIVNTLPSLPRISVALARWARFPRNRNPEIASDLYFPWSYWVLPRDAHWWLLDESPWFWCQRSLGIKFNKKNFLLEHRISKCLDTQIEPQNLS